MDTSPLVVSSVVILIFVQNGTKSRNDCPLESLHVDKAPSPPKYLGRAVKAADSIFEMTGISIDRVTTFAIINKTSKPFQIRSFHILSTVHIPIPMAPGKRLLAQIHMSEIKDPNAP